VGKPCPGGRKKRRMKTAVFLRRWWEKGPPGELGKPELEGTV